MFNKNNLVINELAHDNRDGINCVAFRKDKTVATDNYVLCEVKNPKEMQDDEEFPIIPEEEIKFKDCLVEKSIVRKVLKNLKEVKIKALPILQNAIFLKSDGVKIATTNLEKLDIVRGNKNTNQYPEYEEIISNGKPKSSVIINVEYLKKVCSVLSQMDLGATSEIDLKLFGEDKPLQITAKTKQGQSVIALIMPIKH